MDLQQVPPPQFTLSFSGCGFLGLYHVGVATAIREYAPQLTVKVAGASAGAIAAAGLVCGVCLVKGTEEILKVAMKARSKALGPLDPTFNLVKILRDGLRTFLPPDCHKTASGRLFISMTRFSDGENVIVSDFDSKEDLIQALICSMFIPVYCGTVPPLYKGERYVDGGWSDNLPEFDGNTITVSPFSGESDICPSDACSESLLSFDLSRTNIRFNATNLYRLIVALFPPSPDVLHKMCQQGFEDAMWYLIKHNLIYCQQCVDRPLAAVNIQEPLEASSSNSQWSSSAKHHKNQPPPRPKFALYDRHNVYDNDTDEGVTMSSCDVTESEEDSAVELEAASDFGQIPILAHQYQQQQQNPTIVVTESSHVNSHKRCIEEAANRCLGKPPSTYVPYERARLGRPRRRCNTCSELIDEAVNVKSLPQEVVNCLREAENLGKSALYSLLPSLAVLRYVFLPMTLSFDVALVTMKKIVEYVSNCPEAT